MWLFIIGFLVMYYNSFVKEGGDIIIQKPFD